MGFRPLHDRVLVRRVEADEKTAGGIIIPDTAKEKPQEGEVVAVGPGRMTEDGKRIDSVIIGGRNWVSTSGLRTGISAAQLERINGRPFKFQGFGADEAGRVYADGPALKAFTVRIGESRGSHTALKHFRGEAVFSSRHPAFKTIRFEVTFIHVDAAPRD